MSYYVEYAISLGVQQREGLWKIEFPHPLDVLNKQAAWIPMSTEDSRIGEVIDDIEVAEPGPLLVEALGWLYKKIQGYPYYWPYEGTYVDKFGYDFSVQLSESEDNRVREVEITQIAYDILKAKLDIKPPRETEKIIYEESLPAGGAYVKYSVTLNQTKPVSEISITPFTEFKMEVVSITYEEDIETFHPKKELLLENKPEPSTGTVTIKFPAITARRISVILRQVNYKKSTYLMSEKELTRKDLWRKISERKADVQVRLEKNSERKVEADTGWDIYLGEIQKHKKAHQQWAEDMKVYRQRMGKTEAEKRKERADEFRSEYKEAQEKYNRQVEEYKEDTEGYEKAKARYERDLQLYNKYLRDLRAWNSKWG